jgi:FkbM family methyltransferase
MYTRDKQNMKFRNINGWQLLADEMDQSMLSHAEKHKPQKFRAWHGNFIDDIIDLYLHPDCQKRTAIDIGASYGWMTIPFAQHFQNVYAFELLPEVTECLEYNTRRLSNVSVGKTGLSFEKANVHVQRQPATGLTTIGGGERSKLLPVTTLDQYNLTNVDLIKLDVEGHELSVLKGAKNILTNNSPVVIAECHAVGRPRHDLITRQNLIQFLSSFGYNIIDIRGHDFIFSKMASNIANYLNQM